MMTLEDVRRHNEERLGMMTLEEKGEGKGKYLSPAEKNRRAELREAHHAVPVRELEGLAA